MDLGCLVLGIASSLPSGCQENGVPTFRVQGLGFFGLLL